MSRKQSIILLVLGVIAICLSSILVFLIIVTNLPIPSNRNSPPPISSPLISVTKEKETTLVTEDIGKGDTNIELLIDVTSILGKTIEEIRAEYLVDPWEEIHYLHGYEDILPTPSYSEGYVMGLNHFYVFYFENRAVGFQLYQGLEKYQYQLGHWEEILPLFGLKAEKPPDTMLSHKVIWYNNNGYYIEIVKDLSEGYVFLVLVIKKQ